MSSTESGAGTLIVGASVAGVTVAETLRAEGYDQPITLIGAEAHLPYNRPPLSKQVMTGDWHPADCEISHADHLARQQIHFGGAVRATGLDLATRRVSTDRAVHSYDRLVIATGVTPRRLPAVADPDVLTLRTVEDALAIRDQLRPGRRIVVVGGGILGCELAAAACKAGSTVTMLCRGAAPSIGPHGGLLSRRVDALLRANGVSVRTHAAVVRIDRIESELLAETTDGSMIDADAVIVAIGCEPATGWLADSGLDVSDGVLCDSSGRAADGVYAAGDVARWHSETTGQAVRVEHQLTAIEQARAVAQHIVHGQVPEPIVPFFWTELFGTRILVHGTLDPREPLSLLAGAAEDERFLAASGREGHARALIAWNMPKELRQERARMMAMAEATA